MKSFKLVKLRKNGVHWLARLQSFWSAETKLRNKNILNKIFIART